ISRSSASGLFNAFEKSTDSVCLNLRSTFSILNVEHSAADPQPKQNLKHRPGPVVSLQTRGTRFIASFPRTDLIPRRRHFAPLPAIWSSMESRCADLHFRRGTRTVIKPENPRSCFKPLPL